MEERLKELYAYKDKYEKEKFFIEAKISVVEDMIADEKAKEPAVIESAVNFLEESVTDGIQ